MKKTISLVLILALSLAAEVANADFTFGTPTNLGDINNASSIFVDSFSADGLEMYLTADRAGGHGTFDIWVAKRPTTGDDWGALENLGSPINTGAWDHYPHISPDGLELYFVRHMEGDIWLTTRATKDDDWGNPVKLGPEINTSGREDSPSISPNGLELYFNARNRAGGYGGDDVWVARRVTKNDPWGSPVNLGPVVNSSASEAMPGLSADGLSLFFSGNYNQLQRPGGYGYIDSWVTRRASLSEPWGTPVNLGPIVNTAGIDGQARMSPDGFTLYFNSDRPGGNGGLWGDIYQAPIIPIVDLNADHKIDLTDMHIMIDHWGENYPLCDIGPMPWGDGIVDIQDMIVLTEHLYRLAAHWKLDETDGSIAYDSFGDHDGTLNGNPFWQPAGGMTGGALLFDGIDDYIETPFVLNPSKGSFSVFAWIYCWTPGQVIISQSNTAGARGVIPGSTWLGIDPTEGTLMTGFSDQLFGTLESESVITDIQWHHVGFVYDLDSLHRRLYVDGVLVAEDTSAVSGVPSDGGLYIGASKDLDATSFFSGFIDDVRIYNQALTTEEIATLAQ